MSLTLRDGLIFQECNIEEVEEEEPPSKSSKDKKSKVEEKAPSLSFKITSKVAYKTVLKGNGLGSFFFV